MNRATLTALKESIEHWRRMEEGRRKPGESIGAPSCALCQLFNCDILDNCEGCPVFERTGQDSCGGTPYREAVIAFSAGYDSRAFKIAARHEREFLENLLPEGER